jgi:glycosyltransferase involved in cell wall biosynthesis
MTNQNSHATPASTCMVTDNGRALDSDPNPVQKAPVISVCMPVYNVAKYLDRAIGSILNQSFEDFEFLMADDGSTDGSVRILERYAALDPRIRLICRPHKGLAPTLQELVEEARGEFIARMDGDDIALPERFQKQVEYLLANPDCVLVGSRVWEADSDGDPVGEYITLPDHDEIDAFHFQLRGPGLVHPSVMMRRDAVLAVGSYRNVAIEDLDLFLRLAEHGRLARLPDFLLIYRIHYSNYSRSEAARERSYRVLTEILTDTFRRRNLPEDMPPPEAICLVPPVKLTPERDNALGWRALSSGHVRTARKYARRLLAKRPLWPASWKLAYCSIRGY